MTITKKEFPLISKKQGIRKAQIIFNKCGNSSQHFFSVYDFLNKITFLNSKSRKNGGAPTEKKQDMLRSAILFSCAGLDAVLKQLIEDNLEYLVANEESTKKCFEDYIEKRIRRNDMGFDCKFIAKVISDERPREYMIKEWKEELKSNSLQSVDEVVRICNFLAIDKRQLFKDKKEEDKYRDIFMDRNKIAHEMDVNFSEGKGRNRRSRKKIEAEKQCKEMLCLSYRIIFLLDKKIG